MAMPDVQRYPLNLMKQPVKINSLKKQKHSYLIHTWSVKAFKGTVVNQALPSLHGGSLEIILTVPVKIELEIAWYQYLLYPVNSSSKFQIKLINYKILNSDCKIMLIQHFCDVRVLPISIVLINKIYFQEQSL